MAWCLRSGRARGFRGTSSNTPALGARGTCKVRSLCCRFQGYGFGVFRSQSSLNRSVQQRMFGSILCLRTSSKNMGFGVP